MSKLIQTPKSNLNTNSILEFSDAASQKPLVSIVCITFNHEDYISKAIDSFLSQKTSFSFEIVIHDDASTDGTTGIIDKYVQEYPNLIKVIRQSENQYSKGIKAYPITVKSCSGNYIALCDGDDYWVSKNKLQIQVDALNSNTDVDLCFHSAYKLIENNQYKNYNSGLQYLYFSDLRLFFTKLKIININNSVIITPEKVIKRGGEFMHTGSLLIRAEALKSLPHFLNTAAVSDYYFQILGSVRGGAVYLNQIMSCYRLDSASNSWSNRMKNIEAKFSWYTKTIKTNALMNEHLEYKFNRSFTFINSSLFCHMSLFYIRQRKFNEYFSLVHQTKDNIQLSDKVYCVILFFSKPFIWLLHKSNNIFLKSKKPN